VHGDWTLDNACNGPRCGVNGELSILRDLGCWGDFTMPSGNAAQTRKINSIYYAVDDPSRSKSHDWGVDARVGVADPRGFFLMQGPLGINWRAPGYPRIENASLTSSNWGRPDRIAAWLDCQVHVQGRPDWLFVKLHTHGAVERDFDALFGEKAYLMHQALNETCNDGRRYQLHYVTARRAYNLAKAPRRPARRSGRLARLRDRPARDLVVRARRRTRVVGCGVCRCIDDIAVAGSHRLRARRRAKVIGAVHRVRGSTPKPSRIR
jgi:hypothetical protein